MRRRTNLGCDKQVLTLHETILDRAGNTLASLLLISIVSCAVQKPVTTLDRIVNGLDDDGSTGVNVTRKAKANGGHSYISAARLGDFPKSEPNG
jgi:hypothetical protein